MSQRVAAGCSAARQGALMPTEPRPVVPRSVVLAIAVESESDPRTVLKVLTGKTVRGDVGERVRLAALARGVVLP